MIVAETRSKRARPVDMRQEGASVDTPAYGILPERLPTLAKLVVYLRVHVCLQSLHG